MSEVSDFKSGPFALFTAPAGASNYTGTATPPGPGLAAAQGDFTLDALCGVKFSTTDGRTVAIVRNAAVALATGVLLQTPAEVTAHEKLAMTVPAAYPGTVGSTQILVTNGNTVVKENFFRGGYVIIASSTGIGQTLQIASNAPAAAAATFVVTLIDPVQVALSATSTVTLFRNPYIDVVISPSSATGAPIGVTIYPVAASTAISFDATSGAQTVAGTPVYAFIVTHGPVGILVDSTVTNVGYPIGRSAATNGAVGVATLTTVPQIGIAMQTLTSAQVGPIYLAL